MDDPNGPHVELSRKLRGIAENSGLVDTTLEQIGKKTSNRLTRTKIRDLHHDFTKMIEVAKPDTGVSE